MRISNITRGTELASEARTARGYWSRLVGLLGRASLPPGGALLLERCNSIHTAFMRFSIDVVYVDQSGHVRKVVSRLRPFRMSAVLGGGCSVIELPAGTIADTGTEAGDELVFESQPWLRPEAGS